MALLDLDKTMVRPPATAEEEELSLAMAVSASLASAEKRKPSARRPSAVPPSPKQPSSRGFAIAVDPDLPDSKPPSHSTAPRSRNPLLATGGVKPPPAPGRPVPASGPLIPTPRNSDPHRASGPTPPATAGPDIRRSTNFGTGAAHVSGVRPAGISAPNSPTRDHKPPLGRAASSMLLPVKDSGGLAPTPLTLDKPVVARHRMHQSLVQGPPPAPAPAGRGPAAPSSPNRGRELGAPVPLALDKPIVGRHLGSLPQQPNTKPVPLPRLRGPSAPSSPRRDPALAEPPPTPRERTPDCSSVSASPIQERPPPSRGASNSRAGSANSRGRSRPESPTAEELTLRCLGPNGPLLDGLPARRKPSKSPSRDSSILAAAAATGKEAGTKKSAPPSPARESTPITLAPPVLPQRRRMTTAGTPELPSEPSSPTLTRASSVGLLHSDSRRNAWSCDGSLAAAHAAPVQVATAAAVGAGVAAAPGGERSRMRMQVPPQLRRSTAGVAAPSSPGREQPAAAVGQPPVRPSRRRTTTSDGSTTLLSPGTTQPVASGLPPAAAPRPVSAVPGPAPLPAAQSRDKPQSGATSALPPAAALRPRTAGGGTPSVSPGRDRPQTSGQPPAATLLPPAAPPRAKPKLEVLVPTSPREGPSVAGPFGPNHNGPGYYSNGPTPSAPMSGRPPAVGPRRRWSVAGNSASAASEPEHLPPPLASRARERSSTAEGSLPPVSPRQERQGGPALPPAAAPKPRPSTRTSAPPTPGSGLPLTTGALPPAAPRSRPASQAATPAATHLPPAPAPRKRWSIEGSSDSAPRTADSGAQASPREQRGAPHPAPSPPAGPRSSWPGAACPFSPSGSSSHGGLVQRRPGTVDSCTSPMGEAPPTVAHGRAQSCSLVLPSPPRVGPHSSAASSAGLQPTGTAPQPQPQPQSQRPTSARRRWSVQPPASTSPRRRASEPGDSTFPDPGMGVGPGAPTRLSYSGGLTQDGALSGAVGVAGAAAAAGPVKVAPRPGSPRPQRPGPAVKSCDPNACAGCGLPLGDTRLVIMDRRWHPKCFRCGFCSDPISNGDGKFQYHMHPGDPRPFHPDCYKLLHHPTCVVCNSYIKDGGGKAGSGKAGDGKAGGSGNGAGAQAGGAGVQAGGDGAGGGGATRITWKENGFWKERFCNSHAKEDLVVCCACTRLQRHGQEHARLPDGRHLCLHCLGSVVLDTRDAQSLYEDVLAFYRDELGMPHPQKPPLMLVEAGVLNEHSRQEGRADEQDAPSMHVRGLCVSRIHSHISSVERDLQGTVRSVSTPLTPEPVRCTVTSLLVLYGLPRLLCGSIIAHELMHAWLRMAGVVGLESKVEEGLCQLLAYLWLDQQNELLRRYPEEQRLAQAFMYEIRTDRSPVYGDGFREALEAFREQGLRPLLRTVRSTGGYTPRV
ncbi:hypothetical protein HYH03_004121 [Edaphochlamys debaryana]|uniref:LIM zinc-binding domain-containing protein n=1 Tax=Edaphochlamys debaryana TaxID=47281 RepID=A0A835YFL8_9CHLO|nr:hypothetical protein HYH03_004121 [Edaphochlamys debaryana]|eukprot:KAG2497855.1 hypothetical protein HYH03_004121 [Edaphochlamys debaryana]